MEKFLYLVPVFGVIGLIWMFVQSAWVTKQDAGDSKMQGIAGAIADGAMAFLKAEYLIMTFYMLLA